MTRQEHPRPFREISIDTVRTHLAGAIDFVPFRAIDPDEIAERHGRRRGALVTIEQDTGLSILRTMLSVGDEKLKDPDALDLLASAAAMSAVYTLGKNRTHRSNFKLPYMADETGLRRSRNFIYGQSLEDLIEAKKESKRAVSAYLVPESSSPEVEKRNVNRIQSADNKLGHRIGKLAFEVSCAAEGFDVTSREYAFEAQENVRDRVISMLSRAREFTAAMNNTPPSLAQLAEPMSPLVAFMHKTSIADLPMRYREAVNAQAAA